MREQKESTSLINQDYRALGASPEDAWLLRARCRDLPPAIFFPSDGAGVEVARRYCAECEVREACLAYALDNHIEHGVWGGASERARRRMARQRPDAGPITVARPTEAPPPADPSRQTTPDRRPNPRVRLRGGASATP